MKKFQSNLYLFILFMVTAILSASQIQSSARVRAGAIVKTGVQVQTGAQVQTQGGSPGTTNITVTKIVNGSCTDNPFYDDDNQILLFGDVGINTANVYEPATGTLYSLKLPNQTIFVLPINGTQYKYILAQGLDLVVLNWNYTAGSTYSTCYIVTLDTCCPNNRLSGGFAGGSGRIVTGTIAQYDLVNLTPPAKGQASLYVVDTLSTGKATASVKLTRQDGVTSVAFTADGRTGFLTNGSDALVQFDYDVRTGNLANVQFVFNFTQQNISCEPAGVAVDARGFVYVGGFRCGKVMKIDVKQNKLLQTIDIPNANHVSNLIFGGREEDELYVTTCRFGNASGSDGGSVFKITGPDVKGFRDSPVVFNSDCTPVYSNRPGPK